MKFISIIFLLSTSFLLSGQVRIKGKIYDYTTKNEIAYSSAFIDTTYGFYGKATSIPKAEAQAESNGEFIISTNLTGRYNISFFMIGYVPVTVTNLNLKNNDTIDFGTVYLPYRGNWYESHKKRRIKWLPWPLKKEFSSGYSSDFFEPFGDAKLIQIEYPLGGSLKVFEVKDKQLIPIVFHNALNYSYLY